MLTPLARRSNVAWFCCVSEPPDATQARAGPVHHRRRPDRPAPARRAGAAARRDLPRVLRPDQQRSAVDAAAPRHRHAAASSTWTARATRPGAATSRPTRAWPTAIVRSGRRPRAFLVQDYHLYPLPGLLREPFPDTPILHFTHIPFPDPPVLRLIPAPGGRRSCAACSAPTSSGLQTPHGRALVPGVLRRVPRRGRSTTTRGAVRLPDGRDVRGAGLSGQRRAARAAAHHALGPRSPPPHARLAAERGEHDHHSRRPTRPEQEPAGRLPGVRAAARDAARPVRAGALPGVPGAVAHRPGRVSRVSRRGVPHDRRRSTRATPRRAAGRRSSVYLHQRPRAGAGGDGALQRAAGQLAAGRHEPGRQGVGGGRRASRAC